MYQWKYEEELKIMSYKIISHSVVDSNVVVGSNLHSNLLNNSEMMFNINNANFNKDTIEEKKNLNEILDLIKKSVQDDLRVKPNTNDSSNLVNLRNFKKQFLLTERFLSLVENFLNDNISTTENEEILHKIDFIIHQITSSLEKEEFFKVIEKEFKQNQIIDYLTNLLNLQVKITEKINIFNL
jgi:hypothetical protein